MTTPVDSPDDFGVAKELFEKLKDLSRERQERVLRWVSEGLGVSSSAIVTRQPSPAIQQVGPNPPQLTPQLGTAKPGDIKSFVETKNASSDQQFVTVVAYYYRFEAPPAQQSETVTQKMVQDATRLVGRKRLTNPKATLNNAKNSGYLDSIGRGEFRINTVGENLVVMALPADGKANGVPTTPRKKKVPKRKSSRSARRRQKR